MKNKTNVKAGLKNVYLVPEEFAKAIDPNGKEEG
jgi:hypothetical protein